MLINIKGYSVLIDDEDAERVLSKKWHVKSNIEGRTYFGSGHRGAILLHRFILGLSNDDSMRVDHKDGNRLDCRKSNLRLATSSQNSQNRGMRSDNTTGFKGVCYYKANKKWGANIFVEGKSRFLGLYLSPEEAHEAYRKTAQEHFGEFARTE